MKYFFQLGLLKGMISSVDTTERLTGANSQTPLRQFSVCNGSTESRKHVLCCPSSLHLAPIKALKCFLSSSKPIQDELSAWSSLSRCPRASLASLSFSGSSACNALPPFLCHLSSYSLRLEQLCLLCL